MSDEEDPDEKTVKRMPDRDGPKQKDEELDEELDETFPASDPPSSTRR